MLKWLIQVTYHSLTRCATCMKVGIDSRERYAASLKIARSSSVGRLGRVTSVSSLLIDSNTFMYRSFVGIPSPCGSALVSGFMMIDEGGRGSEGRLRPGRKLCVVDSDPRPRFPQSLPGFPRYQRVSASATNFAIHSHILINGPTLVVRLLRTV